MPDEDPVTPTGGETEETTTPVNPYRVPYTKMELLAKLAGFTESEYYGMTISEFCKKWAKSEDDSADLTKVLTMGDCLNALAKALNQDASGNGANQGTTQPEGT